MNEKAYKKQLEDQLKDEVYYSKEKAPKLYPEINENHGTKKLNKLLDKAKNMSIEEYRELHNKAMAEERIKLEKEWHDNFPEIDYKRWLEERLIEMRDHYYKVNKQRLELLELLVEKHMKRSEVDKTNNYYGLNKTYNCDINLCLEHILDLKDCLEKVKNRMTLDIGCDFFPLTLKHILDTWEKKIGKTIEECNERR